MALLAIVKVVQEDNTLCFELILKPEGCTPVSIKARWAILYNREMYPLKVLSDVKFTRRGNSYVYCLDTSTLDHAATTSASYITFEATEAECQEGRSHTFPEQFAFDPSIPERARDRVMEFLQTVSKLLTKKCDLCEQAIIDILSRQPHVPVYEIELPSTKGTQRTLLVCSSCYHTRLKYLAECIRRENQFAATESRVALREIQKYVRELARKVGTCVDDLRYLLANLESNTRTYTLKLNLGEMAQHTEGHSQTQIADILGALADWLGRYRFDELYALIKLYSEYGDELFKLTERLEKLKDIEKRYAELQREYENTKKSFEELKRKFEELQRRNEELAKKLKKIEEEFSKLRIKYNQVKDLIVDTLKSYLSKLRELGADEIIRSVCLPIDEVREIQEKLDEKESYLSLSIEGREVTIRIRGPRIVLDVLDILLPKASLSKEELNEVLATLKKRGLINYDPLQSTYWSLPE